MPKPWDLRAKTAAAVLALLAVLVYLPLIGWGLPDPAKPARLRTYAVDELLPLDALAEMHNTFVASKADRNYGYPWGHYFALAAVQAPYLAYLRLTGGLSGLSAQYPYGLRDPADGLRGLTIAGRLLSVLLGAGIVVMVFGIGQTLWDFPTGVLGAAITLLAYPQVYYSRVGNPDIGLVFWSTLGLVAFAGILRNGLDGRRAVGLGLCAGLAMGTKDQGLVVFLPLGAALLAPGLNADAAGRYQVRPLLYALLAASGAYVVATGMIVDPARHLRHVHDLFFAPSELTWMPLYHPPLPRTAAGIGEMLVATGAGLISMVSLPVLVLAVAGIGVAVRTSPRDLVLLLPLPTLFILLTLPTGTVGYRYFFPLVPIFAVFAALGIVWIARRSKSAATLAAIVVIGWEGLVAADLSYAQWDETRASAASWLRANARAGDRVEFFGVEQYVPPMPPGVTALRIAHRDAWKGDFGHGRALLEYLRRDGPRFVYVTPDHSSKPGLEHSGDCPPEVYRALLDGSAGYRLATYFPTPALLPSALRRPRLDYPAVSPPVRIFERATPEAPQ